MRMYFEGSWVGCQARQTDVWRVSRMDTHQCAAHTYTAARLTTSYHWLPLCLPLCLSPAANNSCFDYYGIIHSQVNSLQYITNSSSDNSRVSWGVAYTCTRPTHPLKLQRLINRTVNWPRPKTGWMTDNDISSTTGSLGQPSTEPHIVQWGSSIETWPSLYHAQI